MWELWYTQAIPLKTHYVKITMKGRKPTPSVMHMTCLLILTCIPTKCYQKISKGIGVMKGIRMCLQLDECTVPGWLLYPLNLSVGQQESHQWKTMQVLKEFLLQKWFTKCFLKNSGQPCLTKKHTQKWNQQFYENITSSCICIMTFSSDLSSLSDFNFKMILRIELKRIQLPIVGSW